MTLALAYDAILGIAARPESAPRVTTMRRLFEDRTGHFEHPDEARTRAFWDDALTRQRFAQVAAPELAPSARAWAAGLTSAHRGLFRVEHAHGRLVFVDVWGGAEFVVDEIDDASRDAIDAASAPFDARVAACWEGGADGQGSSSGLVIALLPGSIFHPAEAESALLEVLKTARARALETDDVLDALLRMELSLRTLSRVKPAYAYRAEALL